MTGNGGQRNQSSSESADAKETTRPQNQEYLFKTSQKCCPAEFQHIYYRCKQTASYLEQLDDLDLSRIEFPQKDENGNFRLQTVRADDHYLDKYRKFSLDQINSEIANNYKEFGKPQLQHACLVNTQGFSHDTIAAVVLDSTLSLIHLPLPGHETYKVTLNV